MHRTAPTTQNDLAPNINVLRLRKPDLEVGIHATGNSLSKELGISSFLSIVCWTDYPFPIEQSWHTCQTPSDHICENLSPGSLCCSICLQGYTYSNTTFLIIVALSYVLKSGSMSPVTLLFFKIVLAIRDSWNSLWILESVFLFLKKKKSHWDFDRDCIEICTSLWVVPSS